MRMFLVALLVKMGYIRAKGHKNNQTAHMYWVRHKAVKTLGGLCSKRYVANTQ